MSNLVVLQSHDLPSKTKGHVQRILFEIAPGTYAGKVPQKIFLLLWDSIIKIECSAICVFSKNNEAGFDILVHGDRNRMPVDNFGIKLMQYKKNASLVVAKNKPLK